MNIRRARTLRLWRVLALLHVIACASCCLAGTALADPDEPSTAVGIVADSELTMSVKLLLFFTALGLIPAAVVSVTSFTRIVVVLGFMRQAVGVQSIPPNPVLMGIALMMTVFVMGPTLSAIHTDAVEPLLEKEITEFEALERGAVPLRKFMLRETREKDLGLFLRMAGAGRPAGPDDVPMRVLVPSFMISELRTAFEIGFTLFLPFLVIDMVIASILMSMGMMMLPPVIVSLPIKILLFVLVDGWNLIARGLVQGFRMSSTEATFLLQETLKLALMLAAPMLLMALTAGLLIAIFQAVTSIHEMTLTFIPKIMAVVLGLFLFLPWMVQKMIGFTTQLFMRAAG